MHTHYEDILSRIQEAPGWFDENAVPRWAKFHPNEAADIYADEVVLLLIECQACGRAFHVCMSSSWADKIKLSASVKDLHYGDPPNIDCCPAGPTMNSVPKRVLEFWRRTLPGDPGRSRREAEQKWRRDLSLEVDVDCSWAEP